MIALSNFAIASCPISLLCIPFPHTVMLVVSAHELAVSGFTMLVRSSNPGETDFSKRLRTNTAVMVITAAIIVSLKKTHYGALCGWVAHMIYGDGIAEWRRGPEAVRYTPLSSNQPGGDEDDAQKLNSNDRRI
jgi:hypothetical protein